MISLGQAYGEIKIGVGDAMNSINQVKGGLGGLRSSVAGTMSSVGKSMTMGLTLPLVGAGTAAAKTAGDFESQMNIMDVAARSSGTGMESLRAAAIQVGADTELVGISASEAAEAMTNFYKAGLTTTDMFGDLEGYLDGTESLSGALRSAVDLAAASELELAAASDVVAIAMATFGLGAEDATAIADSFVQSADGSVASVSELADAMVNVGPTASAFGWSLEDTNTALAILSERGIRGSEAGTALKSMMTNMMRSTQDSEEALSAMNTELYDSEGNMRSLADILAQLEAGVDGMTEAEENFFVQNLAGTHGMKAMQTLLADGTAGWNEMEGAISQGASAQETAEARTRGFNAATEQLMGSLEALLIGVGTPLIENFLTPLAQKATGLIGIAADLDPKLLGLGVAFGLVAAGAGPVLMLVGALLSPVGLLAGAVAGLGMAWATNFGGIRDIAADVVGKLSDLLGIDLVATVQNLPQVFSDAFSSVRSAFETGGLAGVGELIITSLGIDPEVIGQRIGELRSIVETGLGELQSVMQDVVGGFQAGGVGGAAEALVSSLGIDSEAVRTAIQPVVDSLREGIAGFAENLDLPGISGELETLFSAVKDAAPGLADLGESIGILGGVVLTFVGDALPGLGEIAGTLLKFGLEQLGNLVSLLGELGTTLRGIIEGIATGDWSMALEGLSGLASVLGEIGTDLVAGALDLIAGVLETVAGILERIPGTSGAVQVLRDVGGAMGDLSLGLEKLNISVVAEAFNDFTESILGLPNLSGFKEQIDNLISPIKDVADAVEQFAAGLASIKLPDLGGFIDQLGKIKIPEALQIHSPPPLAQALQMVAEGAREVQAVTSHGLFPAGTGQVPGLAVASAGASPSGGGPQIIQLVVDGRILAEVVAPVMGSNARRHGRMGGAAAL